MFSSNSRKILEKCSDFNDFNFCWETKKFDRKYKESELIGIGKAKDT